MTPEALRDDLARRRSCPSRCLHEIDAEDVRISGEAIMAIRTAARSLLSRFMDPVSLGSLSLGETMALFSSHAWWSEADGSLYLCSNFAGGALCLPIPPGHWDAPAAGATQ